MKQLVLERSGVVIWGAAGHALVVADILRLNGREIVGFIDDVNQGRRGQPFGGGRILGGQAELGALRADGVTSAIVAFGDCRARLQCARVLEECGFVPVTAVHPRAILASGVQIGPGTVVAAGAVLNPGACIGSHVILNTGCSVDHDCLIKDGAHLGPRVVVGGGSTVGRAAWIGIGATLADHVSIGDGSIVGAGAVVLKDIPSHVIAYGVPARIVRRVV